jgi:hypothetical protein
MAKTPPRVGQLEETLDVLTDPALMRQIEQSQAFHAGGGQGLTFEDGFGEPLQPPRPTRTKASRRA